MSEALTMASFDSKPSRHVVLKYRDAPIPRKRKRGSKTVTDDDTVNKQTVNNSTTIKQTTKTSPPTPPGSTSKRPSNRRFSRILGSDNQHDPASSTDAATKHSNQSSIPFNCPPTSSVNTSNEIVMDSLPRKRRTRRSVSTRSSSMSFPPTSIPTPSLSSDSSSCSISNKTKPFSKRKDRKQPSTHSSPQPATFVDHDYLEYQKEVDSKEFKDLNNSQLLGCEFALDCLDSMFSLGISQEQDWQYLNSQVSDFLWNIKAKWHHLDRLRKEMIKNAKKKERLLKTTNIPDSAHSSTNDTFDALNSNQAIPDNTIDTNDINNDNTSPTETAALDSKQKSKRKKSESELLQDSLTSSEIISTADGRSTDVRTTRSGRRSIPTISPANSDSSHRHSSTEPNDASTRHRPKRRKL